jgi:hypothetical protein
MRHVPSNDQRLSMALHCGAKELVYASLGLKGASGSHISYIAYLIHRVRWLDKSFDKPCFGNKNAMGGLGCCGVNSGYMFVERSRFILKHK